MNKETHNKLINSLEKAGQISVIIFGLSLFNSKGVQNISFGLSMFCFLGLLILDRKNLNLGEVKLRRAILMVSIGLVVFTSFSRIGLSSTEKVISRYYKYLIFFPLCNFIKSKKDLKIFLTAALISLVSSHSFAIKRFVETTNKNMRFHAFFDLIGYANVLTIGAVFLLSFFLFHEVDWKRKIIYLILYFITVFFIITSGTRGAYISIFPLSVLLPCLKSRKNIVVVLAISIGIYCIIPQRYIDRAKSITAIETNGSNSARLLFWEASVYTYVQNPIFGAGYGGNDKYYKEYYKKIGKYEEMGKKFPKGYGNAHSTYFAWLSRYGLMFLFLLYFKFILIPQKLYFLYKKELDSFEKAMLYSLIGGFISFAIAGLTESQLSKQVTGYFFVTLVSLLSITIKIIEDKRLRGLG